MKYTEVQILDFMMQKPNVDIWQLDYYLECIKDWKKVIYPRHIKYVESYIANKDVNKVGKEFEHSGSGMMNIFKKIIVMLELEYNDRYYKKEENKRLQEDIKEENIKEIIKEDIKGDIMEKVMKVEIAEDIKKEDIKEIIKEIINKDMKEDIKQIIKEVINTDIKEVIIEIIKEVVKQDILEKDIEVVEDVKKEVRELKPMKSVDELLNNLKLNNNFKLLYMLIGKHSDWKEVITNDVQRDIVDLFLRGYTTKEAADLLNMTHFNVYNKCFRDNSRSVVGILKERKI